MKVFPDDKGVVRTVLVGCRPRHKADRHKDYVPKILEEITVPVQRTSVLLAIEERHLIPPASDELHVCEEELRVASLRPNHQEGAQESEVTAAPPIKDFVPEESEMPVSTATLLVNTYARVPDYKYTCGECISRDFVWKEMEEKGSRSNLEEAVNGMGRRPCPSTC